MVKNVLLICWFNARPKHLKTYTDMYKKLGVERVKPFLYEKDAVLYLTKGQQFCEFYAKNRELEEHYNIIHTFSGGSIIAFYLKMIGITYDKLIIDSGPMYLTSDCFANYVSIYPEDSFKNEERMVKPLAKMIVDNIWNLERKASSLVNEHYKYVTNHYESKDFLYSHHPKLIINNPEDKLILPDKVFEMKKNNNITFQNFYNSKHVQHYKKYPRQYSDSVYNFL